MKVMLREARRISLGQAPKGAVVDLYSHEALKLLEEGHADSVSCRAKVTFPAGTHGDGFVYIPTQGEEGEYQRPVPLTDTDTDKPRRKRPRK